MSLYRRKGSPYFWCKFKIRGRTIRASTRRTDRAKAKEAEAALRERLEDRQLGIGHTWEEAGNRWLDERASKRSILKDAEILKALQKRAELAGRRLDAITRDDIESLRQWKRRTSSEATANRWMALVRSILRAAVDDWEWIRRAPKVAMYALEKPDPRWITETQFAKLIDALNAPHKHKRKNRARAPHLARLARFAVHTGLRRSNITGLRWEDVDFRRRHVTVYGSTAKGKRGIPVPLNDDAIAVLKECRRQHPTFVFVYRGQPITQVSSTAWHAATTAAGIAGFRFHDLRHTWASWHVQRGTSLHELQVLGGWEDFSMVLRYANLSSESLRAAANRLRGAGGGTLVGHTETASSRKRA